MSESAAVVEGEAGPRRVRPTRTRAHTTRSQRRVLCAVIMVAFGLRLGWVLYATKVPAGPIYGDRFFYQQYGKSLAEGRGYHNYVSGEQTAYYPIGYPLILAAVFLVLQHTPIPNNYAMATSLLNVVLGTASVGLVFVIARRLFGTGTGLIAAALLALFPNTIYFTSTAQVETTFTFLFLAVVALVVTQDWSAPPTRKRLVAFGALLGASALVRPFSIPLLVGLAITILVAGFGWRRALSGLGWATLAFAVVVAPWIVRNAMVMHAPTFSTNMGDTVCIDRYEHSTGRFRFTDSPRCAPALTPEAERNTENIRFALRFVRHHPEQEFGLIGMRFRFMMERDDDGLVFERLDPFLGQRVRSVLGWVANGYYFTTLPLAIGGLIVLIRRRRPDSVFVLTAIGTLFAIPMVLWGSPRFHFPLVPFIAITAAQPIAWALSRWSSMITAPSPSPGNPDDSGAPGAGNG